MVTKQQRAIELRQYLSAENKCSFLDVGLAVSLVMKLRRETNITTEEKAVLDKPLLALLELMR